MNNWIKNMLSLTTDDVDGHIKDMDSPSVWRRIFTGLRDPDIEITRDDGSEYLLRWHIIPRNKWFNIYLHCFIGDDGEVMHDHPFRSVSFLLKGEINEITSHVVRGQLDPDARTEVMEPVFRFIPKYRTGSYTHRIVRNRVWSEDQIDLLHLANGRKRIIPRNHAWTLFITGRIYRMWGFHCQHGWITFREYFSNQKAGLSGCGETDHEKH